MLGNELLQNFGLIGILWLALEWAIRIIALLIVPRNRKPSSATAWLLVIFLLPFIGFVLFLMIGSPKLPKSRRAAQKSLDTFINTTLKRLQQQDEAGLLAVEAPKAYQPIAALNESLSHLPVSGGNKLEALPDYDDILSRLAADIRKAKSFVFIEYFIIKHDEATEPIFEAITAAVERGVAVYVLYDWLSTNRAKNSKHTIQQLEATGAHVQAMLPFKFGRKYVRPDLRNHRKITVVDGTIAYTGSLNLIRRNYHRKDTIYYDELAVRAEGPVALQLATVFMTDWYSETGVILDRNAMGKTAPIMNQRGRALAQILPSGPGYEDENNLKLFTDLVHMAQKRITIVNPYFVPDEALMTAMTTAAKRGVEVVLINSEAMDQWMVGHAQRSFYEVLLKAGVQVYWYKAPVLLHSKFMMIDDEVTAVGSSNLDIRSFELNLEVTLVSYDLKFAKDLQRVTAGYLARSKRVTLKQWQKRSAGTILVDNIARLTSALQ